MGVEESGASLETSNACSRPTYVQPIAAHSFSASDQVYAREYLRSSAFSVDGKSPQASRPRMNITHIQKPFMKSTKSGRQV